MHAPHLRLTRLSWPRRPCISLLLSGCPPFRPRLPTPTSPLAHRPIYEYTSSVLSLSPWFSTSPDPHGADMCSQV